MKKQMNKLIMAVTLFAVIAIGGCGKKDAATINGNIKKVFSTSNSNSPSSIGFTYDAQNRLTLAEQFDSAGTLVGHITVTYTANSLHYEAFDSAGASQYVADATLNAQGLVTSVTGDASVLTYDSEGHLLLRDNGATDKDIYTYSNGNKIKEISVGSSSSDTTTYTYLTDKTELRNRGMSFMGKGSKNLLSTETRNPGASVRVYTYEYDSKGRVSKETTVEPFYNGVQTFTYFD